MRFRDLEYVPAVLQPELADLQSRATSAARASGAQGPLTFVGAGMTAVVFCDERGRAFKVARLRQDTDGLVTRSFYEESFFDEAEWLRAAVKTAIRPYVAKLVRYHPEQVVIERECPTGRPGNWSRQGEKLREIHAKIADAMAKLGWSAPEFKEDSYVMTETGPVLVDAGFVYRLGKNLLQDTQRRLRSGDLRSGEATGRALQDAAWELRNEVLDGRLTAAQADPVLEQLYALGAPRGNPAGNPRVVRDEFGVFVWRQDGLYPRERALRVYKVRAVAEKKVDELNRVDPVHVVRTIRATWPAR